MAFHNTNYRIISFSAGTNGPYTAQTIHEVYCVSNGSVSITAVGGGSMSLTMTANQSVKVLTSSVNVGSGTFVGFSSQKGNLLRITA